MTYKLLLLPGDGIGPEIMMEAKKVLLWLEKKQGITFEISEDLVGAASIDQHNVPVRDDVVEACRQVDAVLFGAVGHPKYDGVEYYDRRPELAILKLRKELDLFANLRPAKVFGALANASSLKSDLVSGLDLMIVRETTAGVYFGEPRGIEQRDGQRIGINTHTYTESEIKRVAEIAYSLSEQRAGKLCSMEKANVMDAGKLWREIVEGMKSDYPQVELSHMYADNGAMQLVRQPKQFDVIVTDNLFGDLLSDLASQLTGSLGLLPSATLGPKKSDGKFVALYEPVHGSAPDIAGQGKANPIAMILSLAMLLKYSLKLDKEAEMVEKAVENVLDKGLRTADIATPDSKVISTSEMGDAIVTALN